MQWLDSLGIPLINELLIQIPPLQERAFDAAVVEGVEDVGDVAAVDVVFAGVDDDGELFADVAAAGGASVGVARGGVDAGQADGLAADDFEA